MSTGNSNYKNINVAIYCQVDDILKMADKKVKPMKFDNAQQPVAEQKGSVSFTTSPEEGTTFKITIPMNLE